MKRHIRTVILMKSNYLTSGTDYAKASREIARQEIEKHKKTVCVSCEQNIANQVAAVMLKALHDNFGFGKDRMCRLIDCTESLFELCAQDGKRYQATDCIKWLQDAMGIDLNKGE